MRRFRKAAILALGLIFLAVPSRAADPAKLVAGSASLGGANYVIMSGWSKLLDNKAGIKVIVEATGGPLANIKMIEADSAQIGVVTQSLAYEGWTATGWAKKKYREARNMFPVHVAYLDGVVLAKSDIKNFMDINGKNISVGPAGGTPAVVVQRICEVLGIKPNFRFLGQGDSMSALRDGLLDGAVFMGGAPRPAFRELASTVPVRSLHLTKEQVEKVLKAYPEYSTGVLKKNTYPYLKEDVYTLSDWYGYMARQSLSDDLVYKMVKTTFDNLAEFMKVHKALRVMKPENIQYLSVPLHPGALRYYKEKGIQVPERLIGAK
jgi:TRAP transporter TAXI family solute receptor